MARTFPPTVWILILLLTGSGVRQADGAAAPDKLVGIHSARVMSQSLPWMAHEAGLFKKHNLDFNLVFISSSGIVTAEWSSASGGTAPRCFALESSGMPTLWG